METVKDDFQLRNEGLRGDQHDYMMLNKKEVYETIDDAYKSGYYWVIEAAHTVTRLYAQPYVAATYYTQLNDLAWVESKLEKGETIRLDNSYKLDRFVENWNYRRNSAPEFVDFAGKIRKIPYNLNDSENDLMFLSTSHNYGSDRNEYRVTLQIELRRKKL